MSALITHSLYQLTCHFLMKASSDLWLRLDSFVMCSQKTSILSLKHWSNLKLQFLVSRTSCQCRMSVPGERRPCLSFLIFRVSKRLLVISWLTLWIPLKASAQQEMGHGKGRHLSTLEAEMRTWSRLKYSSSLVISNLPICSSQAQELPSYN